jgi:NAD(P)-dependent dehydrogenase (short-subunit alcohol dehydrogenase family)
MEFANKVALVTGAASGMALLTSQRLAEQGETVVMIDVNADRLRDEADKITASGGKAEVAVTDVRSYAEVKRTVDHAKEHYGSVDIVINYAGGCAARVFGENCAFNDLSLDALEWGIGVNFKGPIYFAHAAMNYMITQHSGVIINIGSIDGITGSGAADYSAAKSGMIGFTKSLALIGGPHNVRACCVSPGPVLTRPEMANMQTVLGRAAEPEEVVNLVLYLCSDKAAFMTGCNYMIDGGRSCGGR